MNTTSTIYSRSNYSDEDMCKRLQLGEATLEALKKGSQDAKILRRTLEKEVADKEARRIASVVKDAKFPALKTFENYRTDSVNFPDGLAQEYFLGTQYQEDRRGLFLYGAPGTGKTHFAIASGIEACRTMKRVRFWRAYDLSEEMKKAAKRNELGLFLTKSKKYSLTIIDEFGFYPTDVESVRLFFELFCSTIYEKQAFILTSNLSFSEWIERSKEPKMAEAIIDRIVHVSHLIKFGGESARVEQSVMMGKKKPARK